jgi:hypothetical protein
VAQRVRSCRDVNSVFGWLLVTQRTANVTKTILNQCNSIFAMRTFDETGKEVLSNYIGRPYADLPTRYRRCRRGMLSKQWPLPCEGGAEGVGGVSDAR